MQSSSKIIPRSTFEKNHVIASETATLHPKFSDLDIRRSEDKLGYFSDTISQHALIAVSSALLRGPSQAK